MVTIRSGGPSSHPVGHSGTPGRSAGSPSGAPWAYPLLKHLDLLIAEPAFADELTIAGLGLPGRHVPALRDRDHQPAPGFDVVVAEQIERTRPARTMTRRTIAEDNGRDVPGEGQAAGRFGLPGFRGFFRAGTGRGRWGLRRVRWRTSGPNGGEQGPQYEGKPNGCLESPQSGANRPVQLHRLTPAQATEIPDSAVSPGLPDNYSH